MASRTWKRRTAAAIGAVAVLSVATAPGALAHECFKKQWTDAAYAQQLKAAHWTSLDVLIDQFVVSGVAPDCVGKLDLEKHLAGWMTAAGISHMPLIYNNEHISENAFRAWANEAGGSGPGLIGSGTETKAIGYIGNHIEAIFAGTEAALMEAVTEGTCTLPAMP